MVRTRHVMAAVIPACRIVIDRSACDFERGKRKRKLRKLTLRTQHLESESTNVMIKLVN